MYTFNKYKHIVMYVQEILTLLEFELPKYTELLFIVAKFKYIYIYKLYTFMSDKKKIK